MDPVAFWDAQFGRSVASSGLPPDACRALQRAEAHFGELRGRSLLDLGCGTGETSMYFAQRGARVTALDFSASALDRLRGACERRRIGSVDIVHGDARDLGRLGAFDLVFGSLILHHIEPFAPFAEDLVTAVRPGGRAFFRENSDRNRILMWCRDTLVGRFGIPRFGDGEERPLSDGEIDLLREGFEVQVVVPEMLLCRLIAAYLLRNRAWNACARMDRWLYRIRALRPYSYVQYLLMERSATPG